jgi:hypothetical protein
MPLKVPAARGFRAGRFDPPATAPRARSRDFHRALIVVASLAALVIGILAGGYGVHSHVTTANERAARHHWQLAAATRAELREGSILFVPVGSGNVCRRRWIDNVTWTLRDGEEVECDSAVGWNSTLPETQYRIGLRMDAVSRTFRNKPGNLE